MARPDQIERMKTLNVQPSFLMNHVRFYGAAYRDQIFGPERAAFMDPAGACVKAGLPFTLHTDSPCSPPGPLRARQHGGDAPLRHRQLDHRPGPGDPARRGAAGRDDRRRAADRAWATASARWRRARKPTS